MWDTLSWQPGPWNWSRPRARWGLRLAGQSAYTVMGTSRLVAEDSGPQLSSHSSLSYFGT